MAEDMELEIDLPVWGTRLYKLESATLRKSFLAHKPEITALAQADAKAFFFKFHPWGLDEEDVAERIITSISDAEWVLLAIPEGDCRDEAIKAVASTAIGHIRDDSKAARSQLQPFQVTKVALAGGDVNAAYEELGKRIAEKFATDKDAEEKMGYLQEAIKMLGEPYAKYCYAYLFDFECEGSWDRVAERFGITPTTFRRRELKVMARRGNRIWKLLCG